MIGGRTPGGGGRAHRGRASGAAPEQVDLSSATCGALPTKGAHLLTVPDVADRLAISVRKVRELVASGRLRTAPIDRSIRIAPRDLEHFIETCRRIGKRRVGGCKATVLDEPEACD